jgi:hypothetical protein
MTHKKYFHVSGIAAYIEWFKELSSHTFIVTPEGNFYLVGGERIPANEFESSLPVVELQMNKINKGKCLDGRAIE